jgi:hypothetical protein
MISQTGTCKPVLAELIFAIELVRFVGPADLFTGVPDLDPPHRLRPIQQSAGAATWRRFAITGDVVRDVNI